MKRFVFTLERIRSYKDQVLNKEKNTLGRLQQNRDAIAKRISGLENYRVLKQAERQRKQRSGMNASELTSYRFFMENTALQLEDLRAALAKAEIEVERQLRIVVAASQEVSGLDKLEEKQREEYRAQESKESELLISEHLVTSLHGRADTF